jgi:uncharacterized coiled-coil protein SlyX
VIVNDPATRIHELEMALRRRDVKLAEQSDKITEQSDKITEQSDKITEQSDKLAELAEKLAELEKVVEEWKRGHRVRGKRRRKRKGRTTGPKKKPGRKKGHPGSFREPPTGEPDRTEEHSKEHCDDCAEAELRPTGKTKEQLVEEIIPARVEVVRHLMFQYLCSCCGKVQWSTLPPEYGKGAPAGRPILGPSVLQYAGSLRYEYGLSNGQTAKFLSVHADLRVSPSGVYQLLERSARRTQPVYDEILAQAVSLPYLHMDETSWYEDGRKMWAWIVGSEELSLFHIDPRRSHKVIEQLLCEADEHGDLVKTYSGVVISDFLASYGTCEWMVHQYCWVHLLREADKVVDVEGTAESVKFRDKLTAIYHDALEAQRLQDAGAKHGIRVRLGKLATDGLLRFANPDVERLQNRINREFYSLLTFLDVPGMPAQNNLAEQGIRCLVLFRNRSFGTRSAAGSRALAHWVSVYQTARKQDVPIGPFITEALAAHHLGLSPPSLFAFANQRSPSA